MKIFVFGFYFFASSISRCILHLGASCFWENTVINQYLAHFGNENSVFSSVWKYISINLLPLPEFVAFLFSFLWYFMGPYQGDSMWELHQNQFTIAISPILRLLLSVRSVIGAGPDDFFGQLSLGQYWRRFCANNRKKSDIESLCSALSVWFRLFFVHWSAFFFASNFFHSNDKSAKSERCDLQGGTVTPFFCGPRKRNSTVKVVGYGRCCSINPRGSNGYFSIETRH